MTGGHGLSLLIYRLFRRLKLFGFFMANWVSWHCFCTIKGHHIKEEAMRIVNHPILSFERGRVITFTYEGDVYQAYEGDTIVAALHANGIKILSHSAKSHEPRGLYCAIGNCSSCLMVVNGEPDVRVCVETLHDGDEILVQHGKGRFV